MKYPRWRSAPHDPERIAALGREARISPLLAQLLINRGIGDADAATRFLEARMSSLHDPESLSGVVQAAERIVDAARNRRKIIIYGDYDVDGVCGVSVLWACLKLAGVEADALEFHIPHRIDEGYGLNAETIKKLVHERGAELIVTVDCGISAVEEAAYARELGVELIITDHHTIGPRIPAADVVVHPRAPGSRYPFGDLCGAAVAFKLAWQICKGFGDGKKASPHMRDFLVRSLGLVALATIADVVPLEGENRVIAKHGLATLRERPTAGLKALLNISGCTDNTKINAGKIGFQVAPRINAAGRLEFASKAVEMLLTEDERLADSLARELDECNERRRELESSILSQARRAAQERGEPGSRGAIVVGGSGWHAGVIGIVAGRLAEIYHRPVIVASIGETTTQASARSIVGIDLHQAIQACSGKLISFGGHAAAAGLKIATADFNEFAHEFDEYCKRILTPELKERSLAIEAEVQLGMLTTRTVEELEKLEPHGLGNPRPMLAASRVVLAGDPRHVGERENHLQLLFRQGDVTHKAIGFNMVEHPDYSKLKNGVTCSIAFQASINEWRGRRDVQLEIRDVDIRE
jgi:single-stranded-DNA-specific exonuclease